MSYSITCSTKILTLAIAPFLFISIGVLCEFAMVPGVYVLLFPHEEEVHSSSWGDKCAHLAAYSSKRLKPLSAIILIYQGYCWIEKNTNKEVIRVIMLIIALIVALCNIFFILFYFFLFFLGFNECLWAIFCLSSF